MKKIKLLILSLLILIGMTSCYRVEPGYVGLKVKMTGGEKGSISVLENGYHGRALNAEYKKFPVFTVNYTYTADKTEGSANNEEFTFQSSEGMKVQADIGISYYFDIDSVEDLYRTYRKGPEEIRSTVVKNAIRDSLNKIGSHYPVDDIIGAKKAVLINEVFEDVKAKLDAHGIIVETLSWVNPPTPPESVTNALNLKVEATQNALRVENEVQQTEAEAKKAKIQIDTNNYAIKAEAEAEAQSILVRAKAEAEANRLLAESITPELIAYQKILKWDGANPRVASEASVLVKEE